MDNREKLIKYTEMNNEQYLEVADEFRDADIIYWSFWTFRELFNELGVDLTIQAIDDNFGADYSFNLDDLYVEDQDGYLTKFENDFFEWDYLGLEYEIREADYTFISDLVDKLGLGDD